MVAAARIALTKTMKLKQEPTKEKILAALAFADNELVSDADYETIFDGVCRSHPIAYVCLAILAAAYRSKLDLTKEKI